jgi:hypothetical protein
VENRSAKDADSEILNAPVKRTMKSDSPSPIAKRAVSRQTYEVKNIEEAVELAEKFKSEGRYDWFRGQKKDWPLCPTAARRGIDDKTQQKITDDLSMLLVWLKQTPGLESIADDVDAVLSIAQHHGLPTSLLDFTTEPGIAGYFASSDSVKDSGKGVIYCLNTSDLRQVDREMRDCFPEYKSAAEIVFIQASIPNHWRLEAQHGVFLFAPSNIFDYYLVDQIEFPHPSPLPFPTTRDIYPERKSHLENELEHFFGLLASNRFHEELLKTFPDAIVHHLEPPPNRFHSEYFKRGGPSRLACWTDPSIEQWKHIPTERLRETVLGEIGLQVDLRSEPDELRARVAFGVARALSLDSSLRKKAVNWVLLPQRRLQANLREGIDRIWNGMRALPYTDQVIAEAIGLCFALHRCGFQSTNGEDGKRIASALLDNPMLVGIGDSVGSSTYGYVSETDLKNALRKDIKSLLKREYQELDKSPSALVQFCSAPDRLFEFEPFSSIFGSQVVPTQVMSKPNGSVFFSPARIEGFGLP